ncbi:hypothetical protein DFH94DRAFT_678561 [Russula ochroleuca]|uniref:Uncharacterized protein n=1 Tax=Russula ochroleuca TaxID=152965 RepID=A0A9P5N3F9_9AGAM|nr:hypothetical protein DFH94DRAFT_678561 [Russula ochroleuca]
MSGTPSHKGTRGAAQSLEPSVCRSSDISPRTPSTPPLPPCPVLPHRFVAVPGLDARRVESGIYRDMGNEREKGERAVMEADKVGIGYADAGWDVDAGKGEHRDVIDVAGALLVSDPNNARDIIGLGSTWAYLGLEPGIWN